MVFFILLTSELYILNLFYTLLCLLHLHPPNWIAVSSLIYLISISPISLTALKIPSLANPAHLKMIPISLSPNPCASFKSCFVKSSAAYGVLFLLPLYPSFPVQPPSTLFPFSSTRVRMVLLSVVCT